METRLGFRTMVALNVLLIALVLARELPVAAAGAPPGVLRARGLEIVDGDGRVRASIAVLPASTSATGEATPETVLLRLITERGRPSVKIAASERASGLSFAGPTGTKETYVILEAKGHASALKLRDEDGREQLITP